MSEPSPSGKRLLSIDGGGFRGLGSLLVIEAIAAAAHNLCRKPGTRPLRPCEIFDLISGSSTGGLLAILLGRLGLDCTTAIQEYKTLSQKLFGDDRDKFMDVLTINGAVLDPAAYENAIADLVARHGENKDLPVFPSTTPAQTTQTAVLTHSRSAPSPKWVLSWTRSTPPWLIKDLIRSSTAAPIYLSPFSLQSPGKAKPDLYEDIAYYDRITSTDLAMAVAKKLWKEDAKVIISIGQWFSTIAVKGMNPDRVPGDAEAQPFVSSLLGKYSVKAGTGGAEDVVKKVLRQAAKTVQIDTKLSSVQGYYRVDPSLDPNASWELVDHFIPNVESSVNAWLATPEGKKLIDEIATKLVVPLPQEPPNPHDMVPPPADPGTHKPNEQCEKPRPSTMDDYLKNYNIIFVIDDSSSMVMGKDGRWEEAREALRPIADYAFKYGADTIEMRFLNHPKVYNAVATSSQVVQLFDQARPPNPNLGQGIQYTPTVQCLREILKTVIDELDSTIKRDPVEYEKIKPFDIILLTDGVPLTVPKIKDTVSDVLKDAWNRLREGKHHPNYVGVQMVQIGNDQKAIAHLNNLKGAIANGTVGSMVDTVSYNGVVTSEKLQRILLGAVHPNVRAKLASS